MTPNREEKLVIDNLTHQGYENILFEPDGNVPPDILVDDKIAIEVRRLNQNQKTENGFKGLEQDEFSVHGILRRIMKEVSDENYEKSAFVGYYFNRPIPSKKEIKKFAKEVLENLKERNSWVYGFDARGNKDFTEGKWEWKNVLLFGSEGFGMREHTGKYADFFVKIDMSKDIESLNISNSAAIVFHHLSYLKKKSWLFNK